MSVNQNLHNYFDIHVCLSLRRPSASASGIGITSHFRFLLCSEFQKPSQTATERGEAELRILDFKTTWSEFQKGSPTAAERGEAELRIFDFKTTWSKFQKPGHTTAKRGIAELCILNFCTLEAGTS